MPKRRLFRGSAMVCIVLAGVLLGRELLGLDRNSFVAETYAWVAALAVGLFFFYLGSKPSSESGPELGDIGQAERSAMIEEVRARWVKQVLGSQLIGYKTDQETPFLRGVHVRLNKTWRADLVRSRLDEQLPYTNVRLRAIPSDTPIGKVFEQSQQSLLILGQPGAGKTLDLAKLIESLLKQAEQDKTKLIPYGFSLAEWSPAANVSQDRQLETWMIARLAREYRLDPERARVWIEGGLILPLLDGLDEVPEGALRESCVQAINAYRHPTRPTALVVTCRIEAYERLKDLRLELNRAVLLEPCSDAQIVTYLTEMATVHQAEHADASAHLASLLEVCTHDDCPDLVRSPLILWVMFQVPAIPLPLPEGDAFGTWLWDTYTDTRFKSHRFRATQTQPTPGLRGRLVRLWRRLRGQPYCYAEHHIQHTLAWVAKMKATYGLKPFYIEDLQPAWLPRPRDVFWYDVLFWVAFGLAGGLAFGLAFGLAVGIMDARKASQGKALGRIDPPEERRWDKRFRSVLGAVAFGLAFGLAVGLAVGLASGLASGLAVGLVGGLVGGLAVGLDHLRKTSAAPQARSEPNQGLKAAGREMMLMAGVNALFAWPLLAAWRWLLWPSVMYRLHTSAAISATALGVADQGLVAMTGALFVLPLLLGGLSHSGEFALRHLVLRLVMRCGGMIPFFFADLLDQAVSLGLLRRDGGGYEFLHPTMQAWFAAQWPEHKAED